MICPRCNQPMSERVRRHKDGSRDVTHVCKRHPLWQTLRERRDATDAQVVAMRLEGMGGHGRFDPQARAATFDYMILGGVAAPGISEIRTELRAEVMRRVDASGWQTAKVGEPPPVLRTVDDIAAFLFKTTGVPWDVRRSDERFHVQPLSGMLSRDGTVAAVKQLMARVPIAHVVDFDYYYEPNVTKDETPPSWWKMGDPTATKDETPPGWTSLSWNGVECPGVTQTAPKPPRPVKVGDVLLDEFRVAHHVEAVGDGTVDTGLGLSRYRRLKHELCGWTHADGAAIAGAAPEQRTIRAWDMLRADDGEAWRVDSFDGECYRLQSLAREVDCIIMLSSMRADGWTFADTGEAV